MHRAAALYAAACTEINTLLSGAVEELEKEWVRGASWYIDKALDIVASSPDPVHAADAVRRVRPGMGPLDVLYLTVAEALERGADVGRALARLREYIALARRRLDASVKALGCPRAVATMSFSRAVARLLEAKVHCVEVVYLAESRPGLEALEAAKAYGGRVVVVPDSAVGAFDYDLAVVGLDGLYEDYAFNKVGSLPLLASARARGIRTAAVFESYKAAPIPAPEPLRVAAETPLGAVEVPLFDKIPPGVFDLFITDLGLFPPAPPRVFYTELNSYIFAQ